MKITIADDDSKILYEGDVEKLAVQSDGTRITADLKDPIVVRPPDFSAKITGISS